MSSLRLCLGPDSVPRVLLAGRQPAGRRRPGGPGAAPERGRAQRSVLRAAAAGRGAGTRGGGGLGPLRQLQQESRPLFEGQVFSQGPSPGLHGIRRREWHLIRGPSEVLARAACTPRLESFPGSLAELHPLGADLRAVRLEKSCLCAVAVLELALWVLPA